MRYPLHVTRYGLYLVDFAVYLVGGQLVGCEVLRAYLAIYRATYKRTYKYGGCCWGVPKGTPQEFIY
jgi:hypothetical protein